MMKGGIAGLMKQAQQMQENMKKMQDQLASVEVEGQSGAGMVKVQMTCKYDVRRVSILTGNGGGLLAAPAVPSVAIALTSQSASKVAPASSATFLKESDT